MFQVCFELGSSVAHVTLLRKAQNSWREGRFLVDRLVSLDGKVLPQLRSKLLPSLWSRVASIEVLHHTTVFFANLGHCGGDRIAYTRLQGVVLKSMFERCLRHDLMRGNVMATTKKATSMNSHIALRSSSLAALSMVPSSPLCRWNAGGSMQRRHCKPILPLRALVRECCKREISMFGRSI